MVLLLTPLWSASAAFQGAKTQERIEELILQWKSDDAALRDRATEQILERWNAWKEEDLKRLREAQGERDREVASRSKEALNRIQVRRRVGERLLTQINDIDVALFQGDEEGRLRVLREAGRLWKTGKLKYVDLKTLVNLARQGRWKLSAESILETANGIVPFAPLIVPLLNDEDNDVRQKAVNALGRMRASKHAVQILRLLKDDDENVRAEAARALGEMRRKQHAQQIMRLLKDESAEVRATAAYALGRMGARVYAEKILPLLEDESEHVRGFAASALGVMRAVEHARQILPLLEDEAGAVRWKATNALGLMRAREHAEKILPLLKDDNVNVRASAARALGWMGASEYVDRTLPLLRDEHELVRSWAAEAVGWLGNGDQAKSVLPLLQDEHSMVRWMAVRAMERMSAREHAEKILPLLEDEKPTVRAMAARAVLALGVSGGGERVLQLLKDKDPYVRRFGACALARVDFKEHAGAVLALLEDENSGVRSTAVRALVRLLAQGWGDEDKGHWARKLQSIEGESNHLLSLHASVVLVSLGRKDVVAQKQLVDVIASDRRISHYLGWALSEALALVHEKRGYENLTRQLKLKKAIESVQDLNGMLIGLGLRLENINETGIWGRISGGTRTTALRVLEDLAPGRTFVLEEDTLSVVRPESALEYWGERLKEK